MSHQIRTPIAIGIISLAAALLLSACSENSSTNSTNSVDTGTANTEAYLRYKRLDKADEAVRKAAIADMQRRERLRTAIIESKAIDPLPLQAELNDIARQIWISGYFKQYLDSHIGESQIRQYYVEHKQDYHRTRVHVAHIFIAAPQKLADSERQVKQSRAHEVLSLLRTGRAFAELAKSYSDDKTTATKGGDLGWIVKGQIDSELEKQLFDRPKGLVEELIKTRFGFHIVKVLHEATTGAVPLEEVQTDIRYRLRNELRKAETQRLLEVNVK